MELALSDVLVPDILLLRGDLSAGTSVQVRKKKNTCHETEERSAVEIKTTPFLRRTSRAACHARITSIFLVKPLV